MIRRAIITIALVVGVASCGTSEYACSVETHTVRHGETAWELAVRYCPNVDPRRVIYDAGWLRHHDHIHIGDTLEFP